MDITDDGPAAGDMVEGGVSDRDGGALWGDLHEIGEGVEEVAEVGVLNEEGLGGGQTDDC